MKKLFSLFIFLSLFLVGCASKAPQDKQSSEQNGPDILNPRDFVLYTPSYEEVGMHINTLTYLKSVENAEIQISDDELSEILFHWVGNDDMTSMLTEAFLLGCENRILLTRMFNLITASLKEGMEMTPFQKALCRRAFAEPVEETNNNGNKTVRYVFANTTYDENINLADFVEYHPFDDEFGICIPLNDYAIASFDGDSEENKKDKFFVYGGGTNSFSIHIKELENVDSDKNSIKKAINNEYYETKYPDTWEIYNLDLEGCLSKSGVDMYLIAYGVGPELAVPEIDCCTFAAFLYREKEKKLYSVEYTMNYSKINSNYEIRDRLYNLMGFYTQLSWCD